MSLFRPVALLFCLFLAGQFSLYAQQKDVLLPSKRSLKDFESMPDDTMKVIMLNRIGWDTAYFNLAVGLEYSKEALRIARNLNYARGQLTALNAMGATLCDMGEYDDALEAHMRGLHIADSIDSKMHMGTSMMNISIVYNSMNDKINAMKFLDSCIAIYESLDYTRGLSVAYINHGTVAYETQNIQKAYASFNKAWVLGKQVGKGDAMAHGLSGMAICLADSGLSEMAHRHMEQALQIIDSLQPYDRAKIYANAATMYRIEHDWENSEKYSRMTLEIFRAVGVREEIVGQYAFLSLLFDSTNRVDSALTYWKMYMALQDSLVNESVLLHQRNLEAKNESEKSKQEIELLTRKGDVWQWFLVAIIGLAVILIFLVIMLYKRNQFRKETNRETAYQNSLIEEKNKNITDSINYASRIQEAVVPSVEQLKNNFADAFVLSKPKDIVSGDFWWCTNKDGEFHLAGADSTGHGVPGGFMSMLGSVFLFEIISEKNIRQPAQILNQLRSKVIHALSRSGSDARLKDGMDMVMCTFSPDRRRIQFACAMNPLWVVRRNAIIEYRADKFPVGEHIGDSGDFTSMEHETEPGDMIYLFSDGYADQFGGKDGKKFKYKQFRDILCSIAGESCDEQARVLHQRFREWQGSHEQVDDVLVIGIRI